MLATETVHIPARGGRGSRGQGEAHARLLVTGTELVIDGGYLAQG
jgi:hypothetical protein